MTNLANINRGQRLGVNTHLIGQKGARNHLNTPALVLDLEALDRNISAMASFARKANVGLRPHAKCHKSIAIAKRQLEAGALGLCCASIGEAEVLGWGGIYDLLITSPLVTPEKIDRLCALVKVGCDIKVVVDNLENMQALYAAALATNVTLKIVVDIDSGSHRTGIHDRSASLELVRAVNDSSCLEFYGLQCYAGHVQHIDDYKKRQEMSLQSLSEVAAIRDILNAEGLPPTIVTGGGTGTHAVDGASEILTELQVGSYVFMDTQYNNVWLHEDECPPFETSLFVQTTVTSSNHFGFATTDAGLKQFAVDGGQPVPVKGVPEGSTYLYAGDEHGRIDLPDALDHLPLGSRIECTAPHCDPTVNLYNFVHCFQGETLVDIWPVDARGS